MEKTLIIGGDGTVGRALVQKLRQLNVPHDITTRRKNGEGIHLDITAPPESWPELPGADVVFFCAAAARLEACEDNPETTRRVNVDGMKALTERVQAQGSFIVFLSTNQVFDGSIAYRRADEPTCPLNEYGRQKAEFEKWLLARPQPAAVLRLTKVTSGNLPLFVQWEAALKKGETIKAFGDLSFAPVPMTSVLEGMLDLARRKKPGIYHLSGLHDVSYYDVATALAASLGVDATLVEKSSAAEAGIRPQFRPKNGTLDNTTMAHIAVLEPLNCFDRILLPVKRVAGL